MDWVFAPFGIVFLLAAWGVLRSDLRVRQWSREKAHIVICHQAGPLGVKPSHTARRQVIVMQEDGTEEVHYLGPARNTMFIAEAVYFVNGAPFSALLVLDQPDDGTLEVLVNPDDPHDFVTEPPSYLLPLTLAALAATALASAVL